MNPPCWNLQGCYQCIPLWILSSSGLLTGLTADRAHLILLLTVIQKAGSTEHVWQSGVTVHRH